MACITDKRIGIIYGCNEPQGFNMWSEHNFHHLFYLTKSNQKVRPSYKIEIHLHKPGNFVILLGDVYGFNILNAAMFELDLHMNIGYKHSY